MAKSNRSSVELDPEKVHEFREKQVINIIELKNLILKDPEYREAFDRRANNGKVQLGLANEILDDWAVSLVMDCESAKAYFNIEKSPLPPEEIRD